MNGVLLVLVLKNTIGQLELLTNMKDQIITNGRWVNNTDGTGIIFGIIMGDGSFAPLINKDNQTLEIMFDDDSLLVPNTDINF